MSQQLRAGSTLLAGAAALVAAAGPAQGNVHSAEVCPRKVRKLAPAR